MAQRKTLLDEIKERGSTPSQQPFQQQGQRKSLLQEIVDTDGMGNLNRDYVDKTLSFDGGFGADYGGYLPGDDGNVYMRNYAQNKGILDSRLAPKRLTDLLDQGYSPSSQQFQNLARQNGLSTEDIDAVVGNYQIRQYAREAARQSEEFKSQSLWDRIKEVTKGIDTGAGNAFLANMSGLAASFAGKETLPNDIAAALSLALNRKDDVSAAEALKLLDRQGGNRIMSGISGAAERIWDSIGGVVNRLGGNADTENDIFSRWNRQVQAQKQASSDALYGAAKDWDNPVDRWRESRVAAQQQEQLLKDQRYSGSKVASTVDKYGTMAWSQAPTMMMSILMAVAGNPIGAAETVAGGMAPATTAGLNYLSALENSSKMKQLAMMTGNAIGSLAQDPNFWYSYSQEAGGAYNEAINEGASPEVASLYSSVYGALSGAIEIKGVFDFADGGIQSYPKIVREALAKGDKARAAWGIVSSILGEIGEEEAQDAVSKILKMSYRDDIPLYSDSKRTITSDFRKVDTPFGQADENAIINPGRMLETAKDTAITTALMGGGERALMGGMQKVSDSKGFRGDVETLITQAKAVADKTDLTKIAKIEKTYSEKKSINQGAARQLYEIIENKGATQNYEKALENKHTGSVLDYVFGDTELSDNDREILADGYIPAQGSLTDYAIGVREAYRMGSQGWTYEQARQHAEYGDKLQETQFRHAWQLGANVQTAQERSVDVSTEEGKTALEASLASLGAYSEEAASVYEAGQDVNTFGAAMAKAATLFSVGADVDNIVRQAKLGYAVDNMAKLTDAQVAAAKQIGEKLRADKVKAVEAKETLLSELRENAKGKGPVPGKVTIETTAGKVGGVSYTAVDTGKLSDTQQGVVRLADAIARYSGLDIRVVDFGKGYGGEYLPGQGGKLYLNINASWNGENVAAGSLTHEVTHFLQEYAPKRYTELKQTVMEEMSKNPEAFADILGARSGAQPNLTVEGITDEMVANACQTIFMDPEAVQRIATTQPSFFEKLRDWVLKVIDDLKAAFAEFHTDSSFPLKKEVKAAEGALDQMREAWLSAFSEASENLQAEKATGDTAWREAQEAFTEHPTEVGSYDMEDFEAAKTPDGESLFQIYAFEHDEPEYREMLAKWGGLKPKEIDELFRTVDMAMAKIKANLEALDFAWEEDINDRAFQPIKQNSDKLYKVSQDFSTLCRKRLLQGLIAGHLSTALQRGLTKEEGIAVRDALLAIQEEGKQIEVACALCYVESARMRSQKAIQEFLNDREGALRNYYANQKGRDAVARAEAAERQAIYEEYGLVRGKGDDATMYDIRDTKTAKMSKIPTNLKKRIQDAKKAARKGYALTAEQQKTVDYANSLPVEAFTTPEGLQELAKSKYRDVFNAFVLKVSAASKSKGIENDTWWRAGDSRNVGDALIDQMNAENGLRTQSWSDFTVKHLMDYIAATIEMSTRGAKQHAYTKVIDYVELMGRTGVMINMSLIPTREFNGKLEYDDVEGFKYKEALRLRNKFPDTAGTICIGMEVEQIRQLLESTVIDYVIPYHQSGMSKDTRKAMHIPAWKDFQNFQGEKQLKGQAAEANARKYGVKLLSEDDPHWHEGPNFSDWFDLKRARQIAKEAGKSGKYGVMTGGYAAMQDAAENYKRICAERGLQPKFSYGDADFSNDPNYWKLLIDRKMVNNKTGEIIEQRTLKPVFDFDTVERILNDELKRYGTVKADQEEAIERVTRAFLTGDVKGGMSSTEIAKVMQKPVDNVPITNITENAPRITVYSTDEERYEILKDARVRYATANVDSLNADAIEALNAIDTKRANGDIRGRDLSAVQEVMRALATKLKINTIDLENSSISFPFRFSNRNVGKSANHQKQYAGSFTDLAKALSCIRDIVDGAQLIETHTEKKTGTTKENRDLKQTYVLLGAMKDGNRIVPVELVVKEFYTSDSGLYMTVTLANIKDPGVLEKASAGKAAGTQSLFPESIISIQDLIKDVNAAESRLLKYFPDQMLSAEQIEYKKRALERQEQDYDAMRAKPQLQVFDEQAVQNVAEAAREDKAPAVAEQMVQYSLWEGEPPKKTQYGFKLMTVTKVGDKWLPTAMFIDRANPYELGVWYKADSPKMANLVNLEPGYSYLIDENDNADMATRRPFKKTTRINKKGQKQTSYSQLPSVGEIDQATRDGKRWMLIDRYADGGVNIQNLGVNGSGSVSKFALRPGIHAVDIPSMAHIGAVDKENGGKKRRTNERWFLIEYPVDKDYNQEAYSHESKDIRDHLPTGGWYSYQTNSGAEARQHWFITGGMKIVGAVSEADVRKYAKDRGFEQDLKWKDGKVYSEDDAIDMEEYLRTTTAMPTPSKDEMRQRIESERPQLQAWDDGPVYNNRALVSEETIDKWLSGGWFGSSTNPNYAQAYIAYMRPDQYLRLSTIYDEGRIRQESDGRTMDWVKEASEGQPIQLKIDTAEGKVYDHEGRHRMVVLDRNGVRHVPVLLFDMDTKYSKEPLAELKLEGQNFNGIRNYATTTVEDLVPLNKAHREEILEKFSRKTSFEKISEKYDRYTTFQFQRWDNTNDDTATERNGRELAYARIQNENAILRETVKSLRKSKTKLANLQKQLQLTKTPETRLSDARKLATTIISENGSEADAGKVAGDIKALGDYLLQTEPSEIREETLKARARAIAHEVLEGATQDVTFDEETLEVNPYEAYMGEATEELANRLLMDAMSGVLRTTPPTRADKQRARTQELRDHIKQLRDEQKLSQKEAASLYQTIYELSVQLDKAESRYETLRQEAEYRTAQVRAEGAARAAEIRANERARAEGLLKAQKEHYLDIAKRAKERRNESAGVSKYRKQVEQKAKKLYELLLTNSNDLHVPEVLKGPLGEFLESLDFTSKRQLAGGAETQADQKFGARLIRIQQMLQNQQSYINGDGNVQQDLGGYIDVSSEILDYLRNMAEMITTAMNMGRTFTVNQMSAEDLKVMSQFLSNLKTAITKMNHFMANARYETVREAASQDIEDMKKLGKASESADNRFLSTFAWKNGVPYYIFKRFGEGGKSLFTAFTKGWSQMAFDAKEIIDFTEKVYTDKEVRDWKKEVRDITLEDGSKIRMTTAQIMELSMLLGREQAVRHISRGGIRIGDIKTAKGKISDTEHYHLTDGDIRTITGMLTPRQLAVAKALQKCMAVRGAEWGNEISMRRFGYKFYEEGPGYYPIKTDSNDRPMADTDIQTNSMFRLLNLSSSKALNPKASNALIVGDIFDTFADHMSDIAKLHGMGLPILDAIKWFNFKERVDRDDGTYDTRTLQGAMEQAFGKNAGRYFRTLMKDINGVTESGDRGADMLAGFMGNFKAASVGANLRVALLQPTSYVRAATVIKPRYLAAAFAHKNAYKEAMEHSGEAVWKSLGYYDTDIAKGMRGQIEHDDTWRDKIVEASMKGAELGDRLTWGRLWVACKMQARAENRNLSGDALIEATEDLFREAIYSSQVMDSTLTRSEWMRSKSNFDKLFTPFMAEPTLSYNILMNAASDYNLDERRYGRAEAWKRNTGKIGHAYIVYLASAAFNALAESIWDAVRDDDDYESLWEKFLQALFGEDKPLKGNLLQDILITGKMPILKDVISMLSGYKSSNMATDAIRNIYNAALIWVETYKLSHGLQEKATEVTYYGKMTPWGRIYKSLQGISQLTGVPGYGFTRDAVAIWNTLMNGRMDDWKIKTYDGNALKEEDIADYNEYVASTGLTKAQYKRVLADADVNGSVNPTQDELGQYLLAELENGTLTEEQAQALWKSQWHKEKSKTFDSWRGKAAEAPAATKPENMTTVKQTAPAPTAAPVPTATPEATTVTTWEQFNKTAPVYSEDREEAYQYYQNEVAPRGISLDQYTSYLKAADTDGNQSVKQDELGAVLYGAMTRGEIDEDTASAIWRTLWHGQRSKTFAKWYGG